MTDPVEAGKAKAAGIVSILIGITALLDLICGFIYAGKGGRDGSGIWTGGGVNHNFKFMEFSEETNFHSPQTKITL